MARRTTLCDKVCQWLATGQWFSLGTPVSSTNKTDCHDIGQNIVGSGVKHHQTKKQQTKKKYYLSVVGGRGKEKSNCLS